MKEGNIHSGIQKGDEFRGARSLASFLLGLLSLFFVYFAFFEDVLFSEAFFSSCFLAAILGVLAFGLVSPWRRVNCIIWGGTLLTLGLYFLISSLQTKSEDVLYGIAWATPFLLGGASLMLQAFNKTIGKLVRAFFEKEVVKKILKVLFWGVIISIILLLVGGVVGFIAGLSATTIIIILLILILLK